MQAGRQDIGTYTYVGKVYKFILLSCLGLSCLGRLYVLYACLSVYLSVCLPVTIPQGSTCGLLPHSLSPPIPSEMRLSFRKVWRDISK